MRIAKCRKKQKEKRIKVEKPNQLQIEKQQTARLKEPNFDIDLKE